MTKRREFLLLDAFFDFGLNNQKHFELCVPYYRLIFAVIKLSVKKQLILKTKPTRITFKKIEKGHMEIISLEEYNP